ncbi:MAG: response regulator [Phycisphaerales bacterium]
MLSREKVDLVLLDINMPNIDGFEALERIQRDKAMKHVAVIMYTGSDYEKDKERAKSLGAIGYVLKPANFDDIIPFIKSVPTLRLRPQSDGYQLIRVPDAAA